MEGRGRGRCGRGAVFLFVLDFCLCLSLSLFRTLSIDQRIWGKKSDRAVRLRSGNWQATHSPRALRLLVFCFASSTAAILVIEKPAPDIDYGEQTVALLSSHLWFISSKQIYCCILRQHQQVMSFLAKTCPAYLLTTFWGTAPIPAIASSTCRPGPQRQLSRQC